MFVVVSELFVVVSGLLSLMDGDADFNLLLPSHVACAVRANDSTSVKIPGVHVFLTREGVVRHQCVMPSEPQVLPPATTVVTAIRESGRGQVRRIGMVRVLRMRIFL